MGTKISGLGVESDFGKHVSQPAPHAHRTAKFFHIKRAFINVSTGAPDAGKPIKLDAGGKVGHSLLPVPRVLYLSGAVYDNLQDFINTTLSSGRIVGGEISDDGDGTITVAAGAGFIKSSDSSAIEETYFFNWAQDTTVGLTPDAVNYIYMEYNAGTPRVQATTDRSNIRLTDMFTLGRVYKENNTLHIVDAGVNLVNHVRRNHERLVACRWVENASGGVVSEPAALKLKTTAGVFYVGSNEITTPGQDTNGAHTFDAYYRDAPSGWKKELAQTDVNNEKYDDGSGTLANIPANKFSARYVYIDLDGHIFVQYGQQGDKLAIIQAEPVPAPPGFLNEFAILAARVIVKDGVSPFIEVAGTYGDMFQYKGITEHGDLAGVTSDQHHGEVHVLVSAKHTASGLTVGHVLTATSPTAFTFQALSIPAGVPHPFLFLGY